MSISSFPHRIVRDDTDFGGFVRRAPSILLAWWVVNRRLLGTRQKNTKKRVRNHYLLESSKLVRWDGDSIRSKSVYGSCNKDETRFRVNRRAEKPSTDIVSDLNTKERPLEFIMYHRKRRWVCRNNYGGVSIPSLPIFRHVDFLPFLEWKWLVDDPGSVTRSLEERYINEQYKRLKTYEKKYSGRSSSIFNFWVKRSERTSISCLHTGFGAVSLCGVFVS